MKGECMESVIADRLAELEKEFEAGQAALLELAQREAYLRERLLMVRGAIQVLRELTDDETATPDREPDSAPPAVQAGAHPADATRVNGQAPATAP